MTCNVPNPDFIQDATERKHTLGDEFDPKRDHGMTEEDLKAMFARPLKSQLED